MNQFELNILNIKRTSSPRSRQKNGEKDPKTGSILPWIALLTALIAFLSAVIGLYTGLIHIGAAGH